jgi:MSHA biogenesis protein MshJ
VKRLWLRYAERIDALSLRERVMVFSAAMAVLLALVHGLYIDSEVQRERRLTGTLAQKQTESKTLQDQLAKLVTGRGADPDRLPRERLAAVRAELSDVEARIAAEERKFTAPEQMRKVIEELLARSRGVELRTLKNLPTTSIAEARAQAAPQGAKPAAAPAERLIYRHGIEVTVTGSYLDLLGYIADLERMPTQLYWSSLEIDARNFPRHTMKLVVYTLSLNPTWLNV